MLLSFAVENFKSFADRAELNLVSSSLRTNTPRGGKTWVQSSERVAAIFGPNASGKTTVLEAMYAVSRAIQRPGDPFIFQPSLTSQQEDPVTVYEIDFVSDDIRYRYEVRVKSWGIAQEALYSYPKGSQRMLFLREQDSAEGEMRIQKGATLTGATSEVGRITSSTMLFLATAHRYQHAILAPVAKTLLAGVGVDYVSFRDRLDTQVLERVVLEMIAAPNAQQDFMSALAQAADLGIKGLEVRSEEIPPEIHERVVKIVKALDDGTEPLGEIPRLRDVIVFWHEGIDGHEFPLPIKHQSSGTINWITTAWHALDALRQGSVLLIDELDSSLHPELVRYLVSLFLNEDLNVSGAQLIFSTHDVSLLGNAPFKLLDPQHVWFTEKDANGCSELFSQAEFENRSGNNTSLRYLAGQFGGVPNIDDRSLRSFIADAAEKDLHG